MTDLLIITREVGYDSGVIVSIRHLAAVLEQAAAFPRRRSYGNWLGRHRKPA